MGFFQEVQGFFHSLTTNDHYAQYDNQPHSSTSNISNSTNFSNASSASITMLDNTSSTSLTTPNGSSRTSLSHEGGHPKPFNYRPGLRTQMSDGHGRQPQPQSDIQLHDYINGQPPLPALGDIWTRLEDWLDREFPELGDDLENGATVNDLNAIERDLNVSFPLDVRESYQLHDGQLCLGKKRGLIYGFPLMDLESIAAECAIWRRVNVKLQQTTDYLLNGQEPQLPTGLYDNQQGTEETNDGSSSDHAENIKAQHATRVAAFHSQRSKHIGFLENQRSIPDGVIQKAYYNESWVPFVKDNVGNNIAIDLAPGPKGRWGQIILFGRDFDTKVVVATCFTEFLLNLVEDLEEGKFQIDEIDEDLVYFENGKSFSYFEVLRSRAYALAKSQMKRNNNNEVSGGLESANSSKVSLNNNSNTNLANLRVALPKETLISPVGSTTNLHQGSASHLRSQQYSSKAATNDSFVLEDEEEEQEQESKVGAPKEDLIVSSEDVVSPEEEEAKDAESEVKEVAEDLKEVTLDDKETEEAK